MPVLEFSRSFLTFRIDTLKRPPVTVSHKPPFTLNNARIQIDCRCQIREKSTGAMQEFVLGANCKTERVGVERDIWTVPNADFVPIVSRDRFMNLKAWDRADKGVMLYPPTLGVQPERQVGKVADAFDNLRIDLCEREGIELKTPDQVVETILANHPVVARTEIENERYLATIEYPVKTMNANERDKIYQTDTGPILLPDLSKQPEDLIAGLELAFSAFNRPTWTEFIVRVKTPVAEGISVYHYSKSLRLDTKNRLFRLLP